MKDLQTFSASPMVLVICLELYLGIVQNFVVKWPLLFNRKDKRIYTKVTESEWICGSRQWMMKAHHRTLEEAIKPHKGHLLSRWLYLITKADWLIGEFTLIRFQFKGNNCRSNIKTSAIDFWFHRITAFNHTATFIKIPYTSLWTSIL